jgi:hypothetical protein
MGSENFHNAKTAKNDEFYTQYPDIQKEINAYLEYDPNLFKDKTILLPCDDPEWSNFTKFFAQNFENLGLKKLISTSYAKASKFKIYGQMDLFEDTDYITKDPNYQSNIDAEKGKIFTLTRKNKKVDINDLKELMGMTDDTKKENDSNENGKEAEAKKEEPKNSSAEVDETSDLPF